MKEHVKDLGENIFWYIFNVKEWSIFIKRLVSLIVAGLLLLVLWLFPASLFVAPFYSITTGDLKPVKIYEKEGFTTINSVKHGLEDLLNQGLVTNFVGVRTWIDNKYFEQLGQIEMYRIAMNALENHLARNRGTGGANEHLVQARADIYSDYEQPIFTSYTTRLNDTVDNLDKYLLELDQDSNKDMSKKRAVFIVNSDNLAEVLERIKQQLQTNLVGDTNLLTEDDKFYKIRGNLIATYNFMIAIDKDFKNKMIDKTAYNENFLPIMESLEKAINHNPIVVLEFMGHVSKIEKEANVIAQKLLELRDKLKNG